MCEVLGVSRSGFYAWRHRRTEPAPPRKKNDIMLLKAIETSFTRSRATYGAPRILTDLQEQGHCTSRKRVQRLMRQAGLRATRPARYVRTTDSRHAFAVAPNVLERDFTATEPDQKWACDITYIPTEEGWLYLAVVEDLFSRRIVGLSMGVTLEARLVTEALHLALVRRQPDAGLLHHSDRGSQYASTDYQHVLDRHGIVCSMSRKGDCWDNAPVESFFATLKKELVHRRRFTSRKEARRAIFEYVEIFYNTCRRHSSLGNQSPDAYERIHHRQRLRSAA